MKNWRDMLQARNTFDPRTSLEASTLLMAPVQGGSKETPDGFYAKGNGVFYRSGYFLSGEDPISEAPEEFLLSTKSIMGNYGEALSAEMVANLIASALNLHRMEYLKPRSQR